MTGTRIRFSGSLLISAQRACGAVPSCCRSRGNLSAEDVTAGKLNFASDKHPIVPDGLLVSQLLEIHTRPPGRPNPLCRPTVVSRSARDTSTVMTTSGRGGNVCPMHSEPADYAHECPLTCGVRHWLPRSGKSAANPMFRR
jgi:hypothetical protein